MTEIIHVMRADRLYTRCGLLILTPSTHCVRSRERHPEEFWYATCDTCRVLTEEELRVELLPFVKEGIQRAGGLPEDEDLIADVLERLVRARLNPPRKLIFPSFELRDPAEPHESPPLPVTAALIAHALYQEHEYWAQEAARLGPSG